MTETYPLLAGHGPESIIACHQGKPISIARFMSEVAQLMVHLPQKRHVLNLCEDRYHFLLGFAAALQAGQVSLLPPSRAEDVLRRLGEDYPDAYCLADHDDVPEGLDVFPVQANDNCTSKTLPVPHIAAAQVAIIVFTSGSTGSPTPHVKNWASLVKVAQAVGERIGLLPGSSILGTIPPQHLYGMETTVLLPLQWGAMMHYGRPLLPADIRSALEQIPSPRWLMTTPLHLRACIAERLKLGGLAGVLSATMPLAPDLAQQVETLWQTRVHDVYGCTEAGIVALRHAASLENWRTLEGVRVYGKGEEAWVEGGHIPQPSRLADHISIHSEQEFSLHGRLADLVKIGGKRASLEALNAELNRVAGVMDGIFFIPDEAGAVAERLVAFAVAPGLNAETILAELRKRIDPVFLPRPLYLVKTLPRNATGKLPRENLRRLAAELSPAGPFGKT
ncbi:MAG TPA: AMP-binding protein [Burkholderiales bacterium]|nr:AMP-binding protein [Burkholderiales bacterium]